MDNRTDYIISDNATNCILKDRKYYPEQVITIEDKLISKGR